MFIAALFTIAKIWTQPKCPSTDGHKWMDKEDVVYIYNGILLSHLKKGWNSAICSNVDGPRDYHIMWSKSKTKIIWYHLYVESKKNDTNELIYKTETGSQT